MSEDGPRLTRSARIPIYAEAEVPLCQPPMQLNSLNIRDFRGSLC